MHLDAKIFPKHNEMYIVPAHYDEYGILSVSKSRKPHG